MKLEKRKKLGLLLIVLVGVAGLYLYFDLRDFFGLTTMSLKTAEKAWGADEFSPEVFRIGSKEERASQVVSLIRSKRYIGEELATVKSELGQHDGYYNSDEIPAYILPDLNGSNWALVFVPGEQGKVRDVIIHKECCYRGILSLLFK